MQHDRGKNTDIDEKTREEILSLIAHHVTAVNYIYRNTKFDGRVEHRNIRFEVNIFYFFLLLYENLTGNYLHDMYVYRKAPHRKILHEVNISHKKHNLI